MRLKAFSSAGVRLISNWRGGDSALVRARATNAFRAVSPVMAAAEISIGETLSENKMHRGDSE